jgi:glycosyltransferase involved in cell wall biosynthesis
VKRRLLLVSQPTTGGTAVVVRQLAEAGVRAGFAVTVACPDDGDLPTWADTAGATWVRLPMNRAIHPSDVAAGLSLRRLMRSADVVHLHSSKAGALGRLAAASMPHRPRVIFTPHAWSWYVGGRTAAAYVRFERWAAARCDLITVTSPQEELDGRLAIGKKAPLRVIENGVDVEAFRPAGLRDPAMTGSFLLCVGRLTRQKGQDRLIRALASLSDTAVLLRLVGEGEDREILGQLATSLGVRERVDFVGCADPRPYLHSADVVVLGSRWEGMSLGLLEAMACGAAIVSTDCGGSSALADGAGVVVGGADDRVVVEHIAAEIDALLIDPDRRRALGSIARDRCVQRHSLIRMKSEYLDVYNRSHVTNWAEESSKDN